MKEISRLEQDVLYGIKITVDPNNYRHFTAFIDGPENTVYGGQTFEVEIFLTKYYPMKPPKCLWKSKIYHSKIDRLGRICIDILKDKWTPALTVARVCIYLQDLLNYDEYDDGYGLSKAYPDPYIKQRRIEREKNHESWVVIQ